MPELADPQKYCVPADDGGGFIKEYEEGLHHIVDTWNKIRSEPKKMVLAILHAVDIIVEYLSRVDIKDAAAKRKQSYDRGFTEQSSSFSVSFGKLTMGLEGGLSIGIPNSSSISSDDRSL